jgi:cytochrome c
MKICYLIGISSTLLGAASGPAFAEDDAAKGKAAYVKCAICHQIGPGAKTLVGPELNGIVGRRAAAIADYAMYSVAMKKLGAEGFVWSPENIDKWIADPKAMIPDSPMSLTFQGIADAQERADIIAYLKTATGQPQQQR